MHGVHAHHQSYFLQERRRDMLGNGVYLSQACFRALDHLGSVGALACPSFGFHARPQIPLARIRAVGPRVRDLYVGVAPDLCVSGRCPLSDTIIARLRTSDCATHQWAPQPSDARPSSPWGEPHVTGWVLAPAPDKPASDCHARIRKRGG